MAKKTKKTVKGVRKHTSQFGRAKDRTEKGAWNKRKKELDIQKIQQGIDEKLGRAGRNTDGTFVKGNTFGFKHGNESWKLADIIGRPKYFEDPKVLIEAFEEYVQYNDQKPWIKKELIKGGDMAGMLMDIPVTPPLTVRGFCVYVGLTYSWWKSLRNRLSKSETEPDRIYASAMEIIEDAVHRQKFEGATVGAYNAMIISRDLGLAEKTDIVVQDERESVAEMFPFEDDKDKVAAKKAKDKLKKS